MTLDLLEIKDVSQSVAREHNRGLRVISVATLDGPTDRVELRVTLDGCHRQPCELFVNVSEADGQEFACELRRNLHDAISLHSRERR
jgi:hypothetical protein